MFPLAASITFLPVSVDPVKLIMSTRSSFVRIEPAAGSDAVTILITPGGKSVCSAINLPSARPVHGVSGAGFNTTEHPAASAGIILAKLI